MNEERIVKELVRKLKEKRAELILSLRDNFTEPYQKELLYLITDDTAYIIDRIEHGYLNDTYSLNHFEEFGNCAVNIDPDLTEVHALATYFGIQADKEGNVHFDMFFPYKKYSYTDYMLMTDANISDNFAELLPKTLPLKEQ